MVVYRMDIKLRKKIINILKQLPDNKVKEVADFAEFLKDKDDNSTEGMTEEDKIWLETAYENWPEFDWGPEGPPKGRPVKYIEGKGIVIEGGRPDGE